MFSNIKTSSLNKEVVAKLTRRFNLGAENIIARIAIGYSLQTGLRFDPTDVKDSGGKEYNRNVLFGHYYPIYLAMICTHYQIKENNKNILRYFKIHLDHGLQLINNDITKNPKIIGYDYLFEIINSGIGLI